MYLIAFQSDFYGSWSGIGKAEVRSWRLVSGIGKGNVGVIEISYLSWFKLDINSKTIKILPKIN